MQSFTRSTNPATKIAGHPHRAAVAVAAAFTMIVAGISAVLAPNAYAVTCPTGQFCYYYAANQTGSMTGFTTSISTLTQTFASAGSGQGQAIRNNAHSVCNYTGYTVNVYVSPNYTGGVQAVPNGTCTNLNATLVNNEASHQIVVPPPATTACPSGQFCYYYAVNQTGSMTGFTTSVSTLTQTFASAGAGQGQAIRNNAHSVCNKTAYPVTVYVSPNYTGSSQTVAAGTCTNLNSTLVNNEASHQINATTACPSGQFCYYYAAGQTGSMTGFTTSIPTLTQTFASAGSGQGQAIRNNAHSVCNSTGYPVNVYVSPNYQGGVQSISNGTCTNLNSTLVNNEAGHQIMKTPTPTPTPAPSPTPIRYFALGDSYSSGEGNPPFLYDDTTSCHRSQYAYSHIVANRDLNGVELVTSSSAYRACTGATTPNILSIAQPDKNNPSPQYDTVMKSALAATPGPALITMTIGGNDIGFASLFQCVIESVFMTSEFGGQVTMTSCEKQNAALNKLWTPSGGFTGLQSLLTTLYKQMLATNSNTKILILGYASPAPNASPIDCEFLSGVTLEIYQLSVQLNTAISNAVNAAAASYPGRIFFANPSSAFAGHDYCKPQGVTYFNTVSSVINSGLSTGDLDMTYMVHPNVLGQAAYASVVMDWVKNNASLLKK